MRNNNQIRRFKTRVLLALLAIAVVLCFLFSPGNIFAQDSERDLGADYDYVLVIDESGSMKINDPQNLRKDAAKLFVYLAEIMNKGNRALISGFGEKTNIYTELTDISNNEDEISSAIDEIKSNQDLTDMKGALEKVKQVLDGRTERKKTFVIFLTDGSLTIDDVPIEVDLEQTPSDDKPERAPGRDMSEDDIPESPEIFEDEKEDIDRIGPSNTPESYLEEYKRDLVNLCHAFQSDGIVIHPIAFTGESEVEILEKMAGITGGICWKADEAADLRTSFIGILENITSRFIKIEEQDRAGNLKGDFSVNDYIKELIVISLKNNFQDKPQISLSSPTGDAAEYDDYIEENIFKIGKISSPGEGVWEYEISGDGIFVYEILDSHVIEPGYPAYTTDAGVPLMIDISEVLTGGFDVDFGDFEVIAEVVDPLTEKLENINMNDSGTGIDEKSSDGIFSGSYSNPGLSGYYNVSFSINHIPTGSVSNNNASFRAYSLQVDINVIEPGDDFYEKGAQIIFAVGLSEKPDSERDFNSEDYEIKCAVYGEQGMIRDDILLLDNGQVEDEKAGDGIYTFVFKDTSAGGSYTLTFFVRDRMRMETPAYTGLKSYFDVEEIIEEVTAATEESPVAEETTLTTEEEIERPESETISTTMLVIIITSGFAAIIIVFLLIYFLIIRPRRKNMEK
jgi:hypothetical protein